MEIKNQIKKEGLEIKGILSRIKNRDFSGNTGLVVKNSIYQFGTNIVGKIGALIFVIILARLVLPEVFGMYNLAFSTIMIFYVFSDLGVGQALVYFSSKSLVRDKSKAKAYIKYLFKIKISLILITVIALLLLSKFISNDYYHQPIFWILIVGAIYIIFVSFQSFLMAISQANNNFKNPFFKELSFQLLKIILIPLSLLYLKKFSLNNQTIVLIMFVFLAISAALSMLILFKLTMKNLNLKKIKPTNLTSKELINIKSFILKFAFIGSSILLIGNLDKVIIGPYVPVAFIGYYSAAFSLAASSIFLITFSDVFFAIFLRMKGQKLKKAFNKSVHIVFLLSFALFLFIFFFANPIIKIVFGENYSASVNMLRMLSILAVFFPLTELYTSYIISKGKLKIITYLTIFVVALSVGLPLLMIKIFISQGPQAIIFGLILGLIISKIVHFVSLYLISRKI